MPPAIRTLPSGRRVAVCPERGSSIGAAGVTVPTPDAEEADARNAASATAILIVKLRVIQAAINTGDRFMASSSKTRPAAVTLSASGGQLSRTDHFTPSKI